MAKVQMTVGDLVGELRKYNPEMKVRISLDKPGSDEPALAENIELVADTAECLEVTAS